MIALFLILIGLVVVAAGAELLVRGASQLAIAFGISPLVIGLTIVAFGTSTPEAAVTIKASLIDHPDLAIGNCIGSSIFNVLFILGICAMIAPLIVMQQLVRIDVPIMIGAHLLFLAIGLNGSVSRLGALLLLASLAGYILFAIYKGRQEAAAVVNEYVEAYAVESKHRRLAILKDLAFILIGLVMCGLGAGWMTDGAIILARTLGVSELVIGLTIIAVGTSIPEVATSVVATIRGQRDIAIGNIVGSNIFNILGIVGLAGLIAPEGLTIAPSVLRFDLPVAIAACVACLPIFFTNYKISRWEGALFFGYYIAYISYVLLEAHQHDALPLFSFVMFWFAIPLTAITLSVVAYRHYMLTSKKP